MPTPVKPIPDGYRTVTPFLAFDNAAAAIDFYKDAFGATELSRMNGPAGTIAHAELKIGDSVVMLADEMHGGGVRSPRSLGGSSVAIFLYVENVDLVFNQAVAAGCKIDMRPADMFWGDRFGKLRDPFGHSWPLA